VLSTVNIRCKKSMAGPECDFVQNFLMLFKNKISSDNKSFTIYFVPFTGSGFPDIVIVLWDDKKLKKWHPERNKLNSTDLKILHHMISKKKYYTSTDLIVQLGYSSKQVVNSIKKLSNAHLIKNYKNESFKVCPLNDAFFVKSIIAIEAKIKNWKDAFIQAETNLWFASESYVLLPDRIINENVLNRATCSPVGLLSLNDNDYNVISKSEKIKMPVSYCSWIFNENIGRNPYIGNSSFHGPIRSY
jgi:hypothetical protein